jgi:hypothetical protein
MTSEHALATRREAALCFAPRVAEGAGERPGFVARLLKPVAIELRGAPREAPSAAVESADHPATNLAGLCGIPHRDVGGPLTLEPRQFRRQIFGPHQTKAGELSIGGKGAGEIAGLAEDSPEPKQRAGADLRVGTPGEEAVPVSRTLRPICAEFHRFQR